MRFLTALFLLTTCHLVAAPAPTELMEVLNTFRTEGPKGWAFTQTTVASDHSRVERFDPLGRNSLQWELVQQDGRAPTPDEATKYKEIKARRSSNETAPNVKDQIIPDSCEIVSETPDIGVYRFKLKPADQHDTAAEFMCVTYTLHRPSRTIDRVELSSTQPFSPVLMVKIQEAHTTMNYSRPAGDQPSLLQTVTLKVRGRAFWFRSLDQDMTVTYTDYRYAGKK